MTKVSHPRTISSPPLPEPGIRPSVGSLLSSRIQSDNSILESIDGVRILSDTLSVDQDNVSIASGPFAQIDDLQNEIDGLTIQPSTTPDVSPNRRRTTLHILDDDNEAEDEDENEDDGFNLYAKIEQAEDQYLVMSSAAASVGKRQIQEEPGTPVKSRNSVQSIIKKLQQVTTTPEQDKTSTVPYITTTSPQLLSRKLWRQSNKKKSADSVLLSTTSEDAFSRSPYSGPPPVLIPSKKRSQGDRRPLPPSPTKGLKKAMTMTADVRHPVKKKVSSTGGHNIYESIDEGEEWLQQLRRKLIISATAIQTSMGIELAAKCEMVVRDFFSKPAVKQLWEESVQTVEVLSCSGVVVTCCSFLIMLWTELRLFTGVPGSSCICLLPTEAAADDITRYWSSACSILAYKLNPSSSFSSSSSASLSSSSMCRVVRRRLGETSGVVDG